MTISSMQGQKTSRMKIKGFYLPLAKLKKFQLRLWEKILLLKEEYKKINLQENFQLKYWASNYLSKKNKTFLQNRFHPVQKKEMRTFPYNRASKHKNRPHKIHTNHS